MMTKTTGKTPKRSQRLLTTVADAQVLPPIRTDLTTSRRLRFSTQTTSGTNMSYSFTWQNLLDTQLVAVTATQLYQLYDNVKIKRVTARAFSSGESGVATIGLSMPLGNTALRGDARHVSASAMGAVPAVVKFVPQKGTLQANWQPSNANQAFSISLENISSGTNADTIVLIDVEVMFRNDDYSAPGVAFNAGVGLTPGQWYYRGLDGLPAASTAWAPQGTSLLA